MIVETVRFKLLSLKIRDSVNVSMAAKLWNLKRSSSSRKNVRLMRNDND